MQKSISIILSPLIRGLLIAMSFMISLSYAESIEDYIRDTKNTLVKVHVKEPRRVYYNEPVLEKAASSCEGPAKTLVFFHGLKSSPYIPKGFAKRLSQHCFNVFLPLLDGHGLTPDALLNVELKQWEKSVVRFIDMARNQFNGKIYLGGVSLGGALSINYLLKNSDAKISGVVLVDAAIKISSLASTAAFLKHFKPFWEKYPEIDLAEYTSLATNAIEQIYNLTQQVANSKNTINNIPVLAYYGVPDTTIESVEALKLLHKVAPKADLNVFVQPFYKKEAIEDFKGIPVTMIDSAHKQYRVISSAHQASIIDVNDPYYGFNGEYKDCLHYYETKNYQPCLTDNVNTIYGEKTKRNLEQGLLRRNMFNPILDQLVNKVKESMQ